MTSGRRITQSGPLQGTAAIVRSPTESPQKEGKKKRAPKRPFLRFQI